MDRSERREEIKLRLEYAKVLVSLLGLGALIFAALQWRAATEASIQTNRTTDEAVYQKITADWQDFLKIFVERPQLRPFFFENKSAESTDGDIEEIRALADVAMDRMDGILTYVSIRDQHRNLQEGSTAQGWKNTFAEMFRSSPILCLRLGQTEADFGLIVPIGLANCPRLSER